MSHEYSDLSLDEFLSATHQTTTNQTLQAIWLKYSIKLYISKRNEWINSNYAEN